MGASTNRSGIDGGAGEVGAGIGIGVGTGSTAAGAAVGVAVGGGGATGGEGEGGSVVAQPATRASARIRPKCFNG